MRPSNPSFSDEHLLKMRHDQGKFEGDEEMISAKAVSNILSTLENHNTILENLVKRLQELERRIEQLEGVK